MINPQKVLAEAGELYERDKLFLHNLFDSGVYKLPSAQIMALATVLVDEFNEALSVIERRLKEKMDKYESLFGD